VNGAFTVIFRPMSSVTRPAAQNPQAAEAARKTTIYAVNKRVRGTGGRGQAKKP